MRVKTKVCRVCGETKPIHQMRRNGWHTNGRRRFGNSCNPCNADQARQWNHDNRERATQQRFAWNLNDLYGMTIEDYDRLAESQNHVCAICGGVNPEHGRYGTQFRLAVDHNHKTGAVRGLLCNRCNRALGLIKDDPALLKSALDYLSAGPVPTANERR